MLIHPEHNRISTCHRCPHNGKPVDGVMPCTIDGRDIIEHAAANDCPRGFYGPPPFDRNTSPAIVLMKLSGAMPPMTADTSNWPNVQEAYRRMFRDKADELEAHGPSFLQNVKWAIGESAGIVTTGGGAYFDSGWITCAILRRILGCTLPIEVWHLGPREMLPWQKAALQQFAPIRTVDAEAVGKVNEYRLPVKGYAIKSLAILHSAFRHIYFTDADAYPLVDPAELFASEKYRDGGAGGAVFTKDQERFDLTSAKCGMIGIPHTAQAGFEMGQILLDKRRCLREVLLWRWLDDHSDYYYRHGLGDCFTAKLAWRKWPSSQFAWASEKRWSWRQPAVIHEWDDRVTFVHRINGKFSLDDATGNKVFSTTGQPPPQRNDDIPLEAQAWGLLDELRKLRAALTVEYPVTSGPCAGCGKG